MRDWIVILLIGVGCLVAGWWRLRRAGAVATGRVVGRRQPEAVRPETSSAAKHIPIRDVPDMPAAASVPNTMIAQLPEYRPVAMLEFEGPPGEVPVRRGETVIGRHSDDDVRVPDVRVSRHHARLVAGANGGFEIHNLTAVRSDPNPMQVNGERREHADVVDGDVITLGGVSFKFRLAAG